MADKKISALTAASTPLAGTEVLPIVQSGTTVKVAVSDLTAGRTPAAANFINGYTAVVSAGATTTLTATSTFVQKLSGSTTQTFQLPSASTITAGTAYLFDNDSTGLLTVTDGAGGAVTTVASGSCQYVFLETAGSTAGSWGKYAWVPVAGLPVASGGTGTTTAFTAGSVVYAGASGTYSQDNAYYFWDSTNHRLGLATTSPQRLAHLGARGAASTAGACQIQNLTIGGKYNDTSSTNQWSFISWQFTADSSDDPFSVTPGSEAGKNWYVGPFSPTQYFQNGRFSWVANGSEKMSVDLSGNHSAYANVRANNGGGTNGFVRATGSATELSTFGLIVQKYDNNTTTSNYFVRFDINAGSAYSGAIAANGAGAAAFISYSDKRLKENIQDLEPQLDKILALRPVTFDYKSGGSNTGFIAQDVQPVYPDAVGEDENGYLTLGGFSKTDARLIKAIQELKADLDATKAELAALKG